MANNGSPEPIFETNEDSTHVLATLPVHELATGDDTIVNNDKETEGVIGGLIEGVTEGATEGLRNRIKVLLTAIAKNEGKRTPEYSRITGYSIKSIEKYSKILREAGLIEFKGEASRTGGYYLKESIRNKTL